MRAAKLTGVLGTLIATLSLSGVAGVENSESSEAQNTRIPALETGTQQQKAALRNEIGGLTEVGSQLKEAQAQADAATWRTQELDQQTRSLNKNLEAQRAAAEASQAQFEDRDKATYNQDSQRALGETIRQLEQQKAEYTKSRKEQRTGTEELGRREAELKVAVGKSGPKKVQMERRLAQLEAAEEAGAFSRPPASGGGAEMRERELEIAREDIVVRPVEPIPYERYVQIYKAAAKRYGFAKDWYVLAAVGKVESNHGQNMGPSSAGAMGPMQFLPSTWREYGVDGNGDGEANIMDPEDAIPAAANYLKASGAPEDWYAALYTYNRAGWYVREVLGVAEGYRRLAKDDRVEPYV